MTPHPAFSAGDTFSYRSVTQGHKVTWTRDAQGRWWADDGREMFASDDDVGDDVILTRAPVGDGGVGPDHWAVDPDCHSDRKMEAANGDTLLGYHEWVAHQAEVATDSTPDPDRSRTFAVYARFVVDADSPDAASAQVYEATKRLPNVDEVWVESEYEPTPAGSAEGEDSNA